MTSLGDGARDDGGGGGGKDILEEPGGVLVHGEADEEELRGADESVAARSVTQRPTDGPVR